MRASDVSEIPKADISRPLAFVVSLPLYRAVFHLSASPPIRPSRSERVAHVKLLPRAGITGSPA